MSEVLYQYIAYDDPINQDCGSTCPEFRLKKWCVAVAGN